MYPESFSFNYMMAALSDLEFLRKKVYHASKLGMAVALCDFLAGLKSYETNEILNHITGEEGQKCTPLLIAAKNGHEKAVRSILKYSPNLEAEGTVKFDGYVIEGASPLWCAAGAGHLSVVKILVRIGAKVNHPTKTNSTPLRAACFDGRLDIVKYLTEHSADIHITNKYNNTCLMIAAYKGHLDIVQYLLELGANPDERAHCGASALHFASECGHVAIVRELLSHNALMSKNENGATPLTSAADRTKSEVVEFLVEHDKVSRDEKIEAYELLGASFASDKDNYDIQRAYYFLHKGMEERFHPKKEPKHKSPSKPVPAYENRLECKSLEELDTIKNSAAIIHMESLAIRERILGLNNPEVPHPVIFRGAVFADNARFDRCLELWVHALRLKQKNKSSTAKDLLRFAQVFSQMIHVGVELEFDVVREVLEATVTELDRNCQKRIFPGPKDDLETVNEEIECNMVTALYLIIVGNRILKERMAHTHDAMLRSSSYTKPVDEREPVVHRIVYRLVQIRARNKIGQTLLHLAVNPETPVDDFHTNHVCKFPCSSTTKLLLNCGADPNAMDKSRNTPLHLIVPYQKPVSDFLTLHNIIMSLIEAGAHIDTVNRAGASPIEAATTGVAEIILRTQNKISLKCQAARAVKKYRVPYKGQVPWSLEDFIELHGTGHVNTLQETEKKENPSAVTHI